VAGKQERLGQVPQRDGVSARSPRDKIARSDFEQLQLARRVSHKDVARKAHLSAAMGTRYQSDGAKLPSMARRHDSGQSPADL